MARRRGKKKRRGSRKSAVPIAQVMTILYPVYDAVHEKGFTAPAANTALYNMTGFDARSGRLLDASKGITMAIVLMAESTIGRKIANKTGVNRMLRKATGNMLQLF